MIGEYDLIVVGAGPGGYVAAIRAAQLGLKTACVEKWCDENGAAILGGTCLNVGCIPSKALLESSHKFSEVSEQLEKHGIHVNEPTFDLAQMQRRKLDVVAKLTGGVAQLFSANGVDTIIGTAFLHKNKTVEVTSGDGTKRHYRAKNIILAPGSKPFELPTAKFNHVNILDNVSALALDQVPTTLAIIGGGVIGLEFASIWSRLGAKVTVIEALPALLPTSDKDVAKEVAKLMAHHGVEIKLDARVTSVIETKEGQLNIVFERSGSVEEMIADTLIVAVGRKPNTANLFSDDLNMVLDSRGFIEVDDQCFTGIEGLYAIGDATRGPMLAHKASEEGVMVVERLAGKYTQVNYQCIPSVIYTHPEVAWVGKTQQELQQNGVDFKVGKFPMKASGRAIAAGETEGFIKILADRKSDRILGVHIVSSIASELISQAVIAMELGSTVEDLQLMMFAHPSISEALHEAALSVDKHAIHYIN